MAGHDFTPGEEPSKVLCRGDLTGVRTNLVNALLEGPLAGQQGLDRQRTGDVCGCCELLGEIEPEHAEGQHALRPVEEAQPLLGVEREGLEIVPRQHLGSRPVNPGLLQPPFTDEGQRQMSEGGQIARRPDRALRRHHRDRKSVV